MDILYGMKNGAQTAAPTVPETAIRVIIGGCELRLESW